MDNIILDPNINNVSLLSFDMYASDAVRAAVEHLDATPYSAVAGLPRRKVKLIEHSDPYIYTYRILDAETDEWLGGVCGVADLNRHRYNIDGYGVSEIQYEELFVL